MICAKAHIAVKAVCSKLLMLATGLLILCGTGASAQAMCDVEPWTGAEPVTPKLAVEKIYEKYGELAFFGKVEVANIVKSPDGQTRYDLKVLDQYKGKTQDGFPVYSQFEGDCAFLAKQGDVHVIYISEKAEKPYTIGVPDMYYYGVAEEEISSYMDGKMFDEKSR